MNADSGVPAQRVKSLRAELDRDAEASGYHLNANVEFTEALAEGLLVNETRFGYRSCPCRLGSGDAAADLDIVCPCDYRDADLTEWGTCYCALYVSQEVLDGKREAGPIPERRPPEQERTKGSVPVWRCRVCGYLCAREAPPEVCPICKASRERFERFWRS